MKNNEVDWVYVSLCADVSRVEVRKNGEVVKSEGNIDYNSPEINQLRVDLQEIDGAEVIEKGRKKSGMVTRFQLGGSVWEATSVGISNKFNRLTIQQVELEANGAKIGQ